MNDAVDCVALRFEHVVDHLAVAVEELAAHVDGLVERVAQRLVRQVGLDAVQGRVRLVVDGDQHIETVADRRRQARDHALRQQRPGSPYRSAQHRIGRRENMLIAEPGARPRQQRGGVIEP